jgi:hypothetical protein
MPGARLDAESRNLSSCRISASLTPGARGATLREKGESPVDYPAGWTCERTVDQLESYLLRTLQLLDSLAIAEHLEACEACAQSIVIYRLRLVHRPRG